MKHRKKKKGASLIIVLMVLAVAMIFSSVTLTTISKTTKANAQEKKSEDVLFSAESGLEYGIAWFNKNKTTGVISVPPTNGCTYDVKVEPDGSNYKIISKATINGKSKTVSVKVKKIETPGTGGGTIKLDAPAGLIIPSNDKILYKNSNSTLTPIINQVPPSFDLRKILNYKNNSKIYDLYKKDNYSGGKIVTTEYEKTEQKMDIKFKENSLTPFNYSPKYSEQAITIPANGIDSDVEVTNESLKNYFNQSTNSLICKRVVTINAEWHGDINLNNVIIYADKIKIVGYSNLKITNSKLVANSIVFEGSKNRIFENSELISKEILMNTEYTIFDECKLSSKKISINTSGYTRFKNNELISSEILINTTAETILDKVKIDSSKIDITGNQKEFKNETEIVSKDFTVNTRGPATFSNINISSENFNIKGSTARSLNNCNVIANNFNIQSTDGFNCTNSSITSGSIDLSGSCNNVFGGTKITANKFKIVSSDNVIFDNTTLLLNLLDIQGSTDRKFINSTVASNIINVYTTDNVEFTNSITVCESISFNTSNNIKILPLDISRMSEFNDKFIKAQEQLIITGQSTPPTITYEIDNSSIKYE